MNVRKVDLVIAIVVAGLIGSAAVALVGCRSSHPTPPPAPIIVDPVVPPMPPDPPTPPAPPPVPVAVGPHIEGTKIVQDGRTLRLILDTAWQIVEHCNDANGYLDRRKAQGFNGIILGTDGDWYGGDVSRPVQARMDGCKRVLDALQARGMRAVLHLDMASFAGAVRLAIPAGQAGVYGADMARRFGSHPAIVAVMCGGLDEIAVTPVSVPRDMAAGVRSVLPTMPILYHPKARTVSTDHLPLSTHCDIVAYQSYHDWEYRTIRAAYERSAQPGRPWCLIEGPYEGDPGVTPEHVQVSATTAAKTQPCLMAYGNIDVCLFRAGWANKMSLPGVVAFLAACRDYYK